MLIIFLETSINIYKTASDNAKTQIFKVFKIFFEIDQLFSLIEPTLDQLLTEYFIPLFAHDPEKMSQLNAD